MESDKDRYIQTLSFHELKQIKNVHGTDIEQRKELKKQNHINKEPNFTTELLNNACNWTLLSCAIEQHGGDLLNITNENSRYKGGNC
jgi:hypothetical protein